jgi:hypothetical protein
MLSLEQIQNALTDRVLMRVARECNLSYRTVWQIARGRANEKTSYSTVRKLSEYLESRQLGAQNGR